ncbi:MAG: sulfotransferase [Cyanobacteriota bacterium]|nr:sulfotransferase [Cyanobacteriota bacterium]
MAPQTPIQTQLVELWQDILGVNVGIYDNFFELGGDSIKAALFFNRLQEKFGGIFYIVALFEAPTVAEFEMYLHQYYPELVARVLGQTASQNTVASRDRLTSNHIAQLQQLVGARSPQPQPSTSPKNPPICFILSAARSGSTLLRIILAGHPQVFAPPQLCLLQFNTLAERKAVLTGEYRFWREGAIQALKQAEGCPTEEAQKLMQQLEDRQLTTQKFYRELQQRLTDRLLVDKTTTYPFNLTTLQRAETDFDDPLYIHLLRHPYGAIHSFEEAKLELTLAPFIPKLKDRETFPFTRRELAELLWLISNQNILKFLRSVPQNRQYRLQFETLVTQPETTVKNLCQFLELDFHPEMLQPYADRQQKMTEGLNSASGMLGDLKFYQHKDINAKVADRWQDRYTFDFLSEATWEVARSLGYDEAIESGDREEGEL